MISNCQTQIDFYYYYYCFAVPFPSFGKPISMDTNGIRGTIAIANAIIAWAALRPPIRTYNTIRVGGSFYRMVKKKTKKKKSELLPNTRRPCIRAGFDGSLLKSHYRFQIYVAHAAMRTLTTARRPAFTCVAACVPVGSPF